MKKIAIAGLVTGALLLSGAGLAGTTAVAAEVGQRIAKGEVRSKHIQDGTIKIKDIKPSAVQRLKGEPGPAGTPGQAIVANVTTSASTPGADPTTGLVPVPVELSSVFTADKGVGLISADLPAGRYIVAGTAVFYAVGASTGQYGEVRVFSAAGTPQGSSIFSGEVPPAALGGVAAQTGASVEINLATATTVTLRARLRGGAAGPSAVLAGANMLITKVG
ncbi:hypothetical protein [Nocardioides halotolerans]|jgi:hypothetical protein|uniref:hypothetical protein n=1 Tax=Nocardioides halotolerans TaxID=433660 RepID=UPI00040665F5|nr:hypothetical protein [Nocardioides halotolerans]